MFDFKSPSGVGFLIDAASVHGGGYLFFDPDNEEYSGVLQISISDFIELKIIGLITTRLPGSDGNFSMIAIGSIEFNPGLNLVWGFKLQGVGVLVGVHRKIAIEALKSGVRNGRLDNIFFPEGPVLNAPRIINDLRTVFPPEVDRHIVGGLLFISWAGRKNSFTLKLGVAIELPKPIILVVMGQLELSLPNRDTDIILLKADIVGVWDQAAQTITVDAALRDSKFGDFPMTGEMALRGSWGEQQEFIVAMGGVNPSFNAPESLPTLRPVQIAVSTRDNPRLRLEGYVALTANTYQVGVRAELLARKSGFTLEGWGDVDALIQFDPFKIEIDFSAGVQIKRGSRVLFSLTLKGRFEAITPIRIQGKVRFKIFFVRFSIPVRLNLGRTVRAIASSINVLVELLTALNDENNWSAVLPTSNNMLVTFGTPEDAVLRVHPSGSLTVKQQVVPLNVAIAVYRNANVIGDREFRITNSVVNSNSTSRRDASDYFAPGQYFDLTDDQKLSYPSFEELPAGVTLGDNDLVGGEIISTDLSYETILIDQKEERRLQLSDYVIESEAVNAGAMFGAAAKSPARIRGLKKHTMPRLGVKLLSPRYVVVRRDDLTAIGEQQSTFVQQLGELQRRLDNAPGQRRRLQVVPSHEVSAP